jgi:hypothetical protein
MDGMTINHIVSIDHGSCGEHMGKYMGTYTKNMEVSFAGGL